MSIPLSSIVSLLNSTLRIDEVHDASVALNGLQIENNGFVSKVALAVDGSQKSIDDAIAAGADLLLLHHGLYWSGLRPLTGWWKHKIVSCLRANLAVYAAHLPLDIHPVLGNNACIASALGLLDIQPDVDIHGQRVGLSGYFQGSVNELKERYGAVTGSRITGFTSRGESPAGRVALCSGDAGDSIYQMKEKGFTCYLTGEENHWVCNAARDMDISVFFAGHYATETFGVRALGKFLQEEFGLPFVFLDNPTGM